MPRLIALALILAAPTALAQEQAAPAATTEVSAEAPAAAEAPAIDTVALAQQLISQARADGVFDARPHDRAVLIRHRASGLLCRLSPDNANRLIVFPQAARGDDVACESIDGPEVMRLYATRYPFSTTLEQQLSGAIEAMQRQYATMSPLAVTIPADEDMPPSMTAQFTATDAAGTRFYTRVSVAQFGPWTLKMRYTTPAANDRHLTRGERVSSNVWASALTNMRQRARS
ncbi:MAG: hypothetical protein AB7O98_09335 [Hyphomonadaceae bacterium]